MDLLTKIPPEFYLFALAILVALGAGFGVIVLAQLKQALGILKGDGHRQEIHPQPLVVREHMEFATQEELVRVEGKVDAVDADLKDFRSEVVANGEKRRDFITAHVSEQTQFLQQQINDLPDKIIANLANLKTFGGSK